LSTQPSQISLYKFTVSQLSHFMFCPKRSKLELFKQTGQFIGNGSIRRGNRMHYLYSYQLKSFDRQLFLSQLPETLESQIDNIVIRGRIDDVRVILNKRTQEKFVSIIELKTTSKEYMWNVEIQAAIFQLQLYIWLINQLIKKPWKLNKRHYLEIYSQHTGMLIKRVPVEEDPDIEDRIRHIVRVFQGLEKAQFPHKSTCKLCPKNVKERCDWFAVNR